MGDPHRAEDPLRIQSPGPQPHRWRKERFAAPESPYLVVPDWICEVLSPSTERFDHAGKLPLYAHEGVRHAWLLDPVLCTLEVLRLHEGRWLIVDTHEGEGTVRAEPFEEVELDLGSLWGYGGGAGEAEER